MAVKKLALSSSGSPYLHRPPAPSKGGQERLSLAHSAPFSVRGGGGCCYLGRGAATLFWGVVAFGVCATGFAARGKYVVYVMLISAFGSFLGLQFIDLIKCLRLCAYNIPEHT